MTHRIFLSYGRKDVYPQGTSNNAVEQAQHFTIVQKVYDHLKRAQHQPWLDKYDLTSDRPFTDGLKPPMDKLRKNVTLLNSLNSIITRIFLINYS